MVRPGSVVVIVSVSVADVELEYVPSPPYLADKRWVPAASVERVSVELPVVSSAAVPTGEPES
jgi:hypothetical protein